MDILADALFYVVLYMLGAVVTASLLDKTRTRSCRFMRGRGYPEDMIRRVSEEQHDVMWLCVLFWPVSLIGLLAAWVVGLFRG